MDSSPMLETRRVTFAAGTGQLDRATHLRDRADELLRGEGAAILPVWQEKLLIDLRDREPRLGWLTLGADDLAAAAGPPAFLGLAGETPCFALDVSPLDEAAATARFCNDAKFIDLRSIAGELGPAGAAIAAAVKGIIGWNRTNLFCARCGAPSEIEHGGWRRRCPSCTGLTFPRIDPVVIMLVQHGDSVLLGRQPGFPPGTYSLLAGFMEPGETIEDAVRRETREETAVRVGRVGYLGCQPWPYPSNLMLGCVAEAETTHIAIDPTELEDARWISRPETEAILVGRHPRIRPPRADAIARAILTDWVNGRVPAF